MILTPDGLPAEKIEKLMLLSLWANSLKEMNDLEKSKKMILAGFGRPTYPLNLNTINAFKLYWEKMERRVKGCFENNLESLEDSAIDYGDPRGDSLARTIMAEAMSRWYNSDVVSENILFTVGGIGSLGILFETFNSLYAEPYGYRVITPFPHYPVYSNNKYHHLHPVDVMNQPGYQLTATALETSIKEAYCFGELDKGYPRVVLICNPSNPLGTVIPTNELIKIAAVLRKYPDLYIVFDEAYTEMCYVEMPSFLEIAPDLKERTVILRSATKALSAAGERMAVLLAFEKNLLNEISKNIIRHFIHAPRSSQFAYAQTMSNFNKEDKNKLSAYYKERIDYVVRRLKDMGAEMERDDYNVDATFYVLGDFTDLFQLEINKEAQKVLGKSGKITTGEELVYHLLFEESLMVAPLCYFGLPENCGVIRITCSSSFNELKEIMDRLEVQLLSARIIKRDKLLNEYKLTFNKNKDPVLKTLLKELNLNESPTTCVKLKNQLDLLQKFISLKDENFEEQTVVF